MGNTTEHTSGNFALRGNFAHLKKYFITFFICKCHILYRLVIYAVTGLLLFAF